MGLFRFRKTAESEPLGTSISWTAKLKFSALIRSNSQHGTKEPIASSPIHVNCQPASMLRRADTTSTLSHSSTQPSIAGSRSPSELFCASPTDTSFTASSLHRTPSIYSHRSYNIRRDSIKGRPPILPRSSHADVPPPLPQAVSEDGLVLTATSRYPTGIAAELYIPEDCTYKLVTQREKIARRQNLREQLKRTSSMTRRTTIVQSPQEKLRLKRMSINF